MVSALAYHRDTTPGVLEWARRHRVLTWSLAWGVTGIGLLASDVFSTPREGPLWPAVLFGITSWSLAGAATFHRTNLRLGMAVWAASYLLAFALGAVWGQWFERATVGSVSSAGFVGALLGWAVGAAIGALVSGRIDGRHSRPGRLGVFATVWGACFFGGGFFGLVAALILGQLAEGLLAFTGAPNAALFAGFGLGSALGGAAASFIGMVLYASLLDVSPRTIRRER